MLAGNVSATLIGNTLRVVGDANANDISIRLVEGPLTNQIATLEVSGNNTTVNGANAPFTISAPRVGGAIDLSLDVFTLAGDDVVRFDHLDLNGQLEVSMGGGLDVLQIESSEFHANVLIKTGGDRDAIDITSTTVFDTATSFILRTHAGNDLLNLDGVKFDGRSARFVMGIGEDVISANEVSGVARFWHFLTQGGNDVVDIANSTLGTSRIAVSTGNDLVELSGLTMTGTLNLETGAQDDITNIDNSTLRLLNLNTAVGEDTVTIADSNVINLAANLGFTSDRFTSQNTVYSNNIDFNAGQGDDQIIFVGGSVAGSSSIDGGSDLDLLSATAGFFTVAPTVLNVEAVNI